MLPLEHLQVGVLLLILFITVLSIVGLRIAALVGKHHVNRESKRAIERARD